MRMSCRPANALQYRNRSALSSATLIPTALELVFAGLNFLGSECFYDRKLLRWDFRTMIGNIVHAQ